MIQNKDGKAFFPLESFLNQMKKLFLTDKTALFLKKDWN